MNAKFNESAFPVTWPEPNGPERGMTLRDYFAAAAMQGWLSSYGERDEHPATNRNFAERVADLSYKLAEAMIARRDK
jgi:hypothetical protein